MITSKWAKATAGIISILLISFILYSCKDKTEIVGGGSSDINNPPAAETIALSGQVINHVTGAPIKDAILDIKGGTDEVTVTTDVQGKYNAEVQSTSNVNLIIITSKDNYNVDTLSVFATVGQPLNAPLISLVPNGTGVIPSGDPVSIYISEVSSPVIGVKESGAEETTNMVFVVQDSSGIPVDLDHSVTVNFYLAAGPGGGELLSPSSVNTNNIGQAVVNLTSGTIAGVVQVIAEIDLPNTVIRSLPVSVTIHGGLPDQAHFSIAPHYVNFAGYNIYGLTDNITAFVGDKYANPVRPGTAVYFTTTGGIIEGSTLTNDQGIGSVDLISAAPQPNDAVLGPGFARITASTADENQNIISDETVVLFSGVPQITVSPTTFNIPNGGSQFFTYTVSDQNNNPLASGTNITVHVSGDDTGAGGDLNLTLPDTQSPLWTQFGFSVYDTKDTLDVVKTVSITISSSGSNGAAHITISGVHH